MLLADWEIRKLCVDDYGVELPNAMIKPFSESVSGNNVISWGNTSAGYDLRLGPEILMFKNTSGEPIDPKRFRESEYTKKIFDEFIIGQNRDNPTQGYSFVIPAHSYVLGRAFERLHIPRNIKGRCVGKSTLARSGILINCTPLEPSWEGFLTIEIGNVTPCPVRIPIMEGIAQIEFELIQGIVDVSYADKNGIYQNQVGVTPSRTKQ